MGDFNLISPANLSSDATTSPLLKWDAFEVGILNPIQGYVVLGTNPNPEFEPSRPFDPNMAGDEGDYQLTGLQENTTYYWWIYYDCDGGSTASSDVWSFNTGGQALQVPASAPTMIYPISGSVGVPVTPTITFNPVSGATGYDIQIGTSWDFGGGFQVDVSNVASEGSYVVQTTLSRDWSTYYLRIRSRNSVGVSNWSERIIFELMLDEITVFNPVTESILEGGFGWNSIGNVNGYDLKITEIDTGRIVANRSMGPNGYSQMNEFRIGLQYKVEVRGVAANGNYGPWATVYYSYGRIKTQSGTTPKSKILENSDSIIWNGKINKNRIGSFKYNNLFDVLLQKKKDLEIILNYKKTKRRKI